MQQAIIKNKYVRFEESSEGCANGKAVRLLESQGVVHAIEVRCSCGEVTVLELEYAEDKKLDGIDS